MEEPLMYRSVSIFSLVKGLGADSRADLLTELRDTTGYDYINYEPLYPAEVVVKVIDFFVDKFYPEWPESEALRALGRCSMAGWVSTDFGRVTLLSLPLRHPAKAMNFLPSVFDRNRLFGRRFVEQISQNQWVLNMSEEVLPAHYLAGQLEVACEMSRLYDFAVIVGPKVDHTLTQLTIELILNHPFEEIT